MLKANLQTVRSVLAIVFACVMLVMIYAWTEKVYAQGWRSETAKVHDSLSKAGVDRETILAEAEAPKITLSRKSQRMVDKFVQQNEEGLAKVQTRSASYFKTIENIFQKEGLPVQLKYLAVVESNLKATAVSHCGALGIWQLMPETARNYGLKINRYTDERKHLYKSTVAAAKYMNALYAEFGDWLLVVAAYNGGSGSVHNAIKKCGSKNYYVLHRYLPAETKAHVEHFIATHYYFEGTGSMVTLTKKEAGQHVQKVSDYLSKRTCELEQLEAIAQKEAMATKPVVALKE